MDTAISVFDLVGSKIFYLLPIEDILKCRTVCRQFKSVLDDPYLWLKLLKFIGHPEQCHKQWIDLIQKSNEVGIVKETFVNLLIQKSKIPYGSFQSKNQQKWMFCMPPIYNAVKVGNLIVVKAIAHFDKEFYKPLPNHCGEDWTAFTEAAENGHFEIAEFIESQIQTQKIDNETCLAMKQIRSTKMIRAIKSNQIEVAKFLSKHIKNPLNYVRKGDNGGPFHIAADFGHFELLEYFAQMAGEDIHNITDEDGNNVITVAMKDIGYEDQYNYTEMMILNTLMKYDPNRATPLHHAAKMGFLDVCKLYQRYINVKDKNGDTPIHYAASSKAELYPAVCVMNFLTSITKNPNVPNSKNQTPLHIAIAHSNPHLDSPMCQIELISLLAKSGQNLNFQDSQGQTPLHCAVTHYNRFMFEKVLNLINPVSSVNVPDNKGMKPLDIALHDSNEHAVRILAPLTEDLNIAEEIRNHPARAGNVKFSACLKIIDEHKRERGITSNSNQ